MTGVAVRPLAVADLAVAARLHAALLPHGFPLTALLLGSRKLADLRARLRR
jgi:hypothetical protein